MENGIYASLTRQSGLKAQMQSIANNIANLSTAGFRREGVMFAEYVNSLEGGRDSVSMPLASVRQIDLSQGPISPTGGTFDLAIEGDGFFAVQTQAGQMLTRAGAFAPNEAGELVTPDGDQLLDLSGAPIFIPPDVTGVSIGRDGTIAAGDRVIGQIGLLAPVDPMSLQRIGSGLFDPGGAVIPVENSAILQGMIEKSNVNPISEIARMIEVQNAYERGIGFIEKEDERIRNVIQTLGR